MWLWEPAYLPGSVWATISVCPSLLRPGERQIERAKPIRQTMTTMAPVICATVSMIEAYSVEPSIRIRHWSKRNQEPTQRDKAMRGQHERDADSEAQRRSTEPAEIRRR